MRVIGSDDDLALCGPSGAVEGDLVVALGADHADGADIVFTEHGAVAAGTRAVAPAGDGLWRRAPWPVADALFDLPPGAGALVVGGPAETRTHVVHELEQRGRSASAAERLTVAGLEASATVVLLADHDALPAHGMCVLAARRALVTVGATTRFGLYPGIEVLTAATPDEAVEHANMTLVHPDAMRMPAALGAVAAERHRASHVYARLAVDIALT